MIKRQQAVLGAVSASNFRRTEMEEQQGLTLQTRIPRFFKPGMSGLGDLGRGGGGGGHGGGGHGGGGHGGGGHGFIGRANSRVFIGGGGGWGGWGGYGWPWWGYNYPYYQQPVCASPCRPLNIGGYGCYTTEGNLAQCVPRGAALAGCR